MEKKGWTVRDDNARGDEARTHEIAIETFDDGREPIVKRYALYADKDTTMPMEHALKFLTDIAFVVRDPEGRRITPPPKVEGGTGNFELPETQTIANWDELSRAALFKRCKVIPGSEAILPTAEPASMVEFLVRWRRAQKKGVDGIAEALKEQIAGSDTIGETMDTEGTSSLFGGDSPLMSKVAA